MRSGSGIVCAAAAAVKTMATAHPATAGRQQHLSTGIISAASSASATSTFQTLEELRAFMHGTPEQP
jgi:uncharacterized protein YsxB (DUF464 family)